MNIQYVKGDATRPIGKGVIFLIHCCNDVGVWGRGFVVSLSKRWKQPETEYRLWYRNDGPRFNSSGSFNLGQVQYVPVEDTYDKSIVVCNMIGQNGIISQENPTPIKYDAIESCLKKIVITINKFKNKEIKDYSDSSRYGFSVHGPRFGSGLAGGKWDQIERLLKTQVIDQGIPVIIYDF